ncbi:MAG: hypothetical protein ACPGRH_05255 [Alphaproteobacteria bacterium]
MHKAKLTAIVSSLLLGSTITSAEKGSGSKASLSLLELDNPLEGCLIVGAEIARDPAEGVDQTIYSEIDTLIWAITFDQSLVEIEFEGDFYFARSEHVKVERCAPSESFFQ